MGHSFRTTATVTATRPSTHESSDVPCERKALQVCMFANGARAYFRPTICLFADVSRETLDVRAVTLYGRRDDFGECLARSLQQALDVRACIALRSQSVRATKLLPLPKGGSEKGDSSHWSPKSILNSDLFSGSPSGSPSSDPPFWGR